LKKKKQNQKKNKRRFFPNCKIAYIISRRAGLICSVLTARKPIGRTRNWFSHQFGPSTGHCLKKLLVESKENQNAVLFPIV